MLFAYQTLTPEDADGDAIFAAPAALAWAGLGSALALGCFALAGALLSRRGLGEALGFSPGARISGRSWRPIALGTIGLSFLLDLSLRALGVRADSALANFDAAITGARGDDLVLLLLGLALAPAIAEELMFRGVVLGALCRRTPAWLALILSSALFGAVHLDPVHAFAAGLLGLYLGAAALATRTTGTAIAAHAANNGFAVLTGAFALEPSDPAGVAVGTLVALGLVALGTRAVARDWRREPHPQGNAAHPDRSDDEAELVAGGHVVGERVTRIDRDAQQDGPEQE